MRNHSPCISKHAYPHRSLFFLSSLDKNCPPGVAVAQLPALEKVAVGAFRDRPPDVAWATADAIHETEWQQPNIVPIFRRSRNRVARDKGQQAFPWVDNALAQWERAGNSVGIGYTNKVMLRNRNFWST
jgi:hypothetical protein